MTFFSGLGLSRLHKHGFKGQLIERFPWKVLLNVLFVTVKNHCLGLENTVAVILWQSQREVHNLTVMPLDAEKALKRAGQIQLQEVSTGSLETTKYSQTTKYSALCDR